MNRRVNITLPEGTLRLIDRSVAKGDRSRLIDEAVRQFMQKRGRARLRELLVAGAQARAARDRALAEEWFTLEEESWRKRRR